MAGGCFSSRYDTSLRYCVAGCFCLGGRPKPDACDLSKPYFLSASVGLVALHSGRVTCATYCAS